jgi:hypothetical protein
MKRQEFTSPELLAIVTADIGTFWADSCCNTLITLKLPETGRQKRTLVLTPGYISRLRQPTLRSPCISYSSILTVL